MIYQGRARYAVQEVILHTLDVPTGWHKGKTVDQIVTAVRDWHVNGNGWRDIGYHRVFAPDGTMGLGRSLWTIGAHTMERNRGTIGIAMCNVKKHDGITKFEDYFTKDQREAVKAYIAELQRWTTIKWVTGHNDYAARECPGFRVKSEDWV
jgi:hypothetical protein